MVMTLSPSVYLDEYVTALHQTGDLTEEQWDVLIEGLYDIRTTDPEGSYVEHLDLLQALVSCKNTSRLLDVVARLTSDGHDLYPSYTQYALLFEVLASRLFSSDVASDEQMQFSQLLLASLESDFAAFDLRPLRIILTHFATCVSIAQQASHGLLVTYEQVIALVVANLDGPDLGYLLEPTVRELVIQRPQLEQLIVLCSPNALGGFILATRAILASSISVEFEKNFADVSYTYLTLFSSSSTNVIDNIPLILDALCDRLTQDNTLVIPYVVIDDLLKIIHFVLNSDVFDHAGTREDVGDENQEEFRDSAQRELARRCGEGVEDALSIANRELGAQQHEWRLNVELYNKFKLLMKLALERLEPQCSSICRIIHNYPVLKSSLTIQWFFRFIFTKRIFQLNESERVLLLADLCEEYLVQETRIEVVECFFSHLVSLFHSDQREKPTLPLLFGDVRAEVRTIVDYLEGTTASLTELSPTLLIPLLQLTLKLFDCGGDSSSADLLSLLQSQLQRLRDAITSGSHLDLHVDSLALRLTTNFTYHFSRSHSAAVPVQLFEFIMFLVKPDATTQICRLTDRTSESMLRFLTSLRSNIVGQVCLATCDGQLVNTRLYWEHKRSGDLLNIYFTLDFVTLYKELVTQFVNKEWEQDGELQSFLNGLNAMLSDLYLLSDLPLTVTHGVGTSFDKIADTMIILAEEHRDNKDLRKCFARSYAIMLQHGLSSEMQCFISHQIIEFRYWHIATADSCIVLAKMLEANDSDNMTRYFTGHLLDLSHAKLLKTDGYHVLLILTVLLQTIESLPYFDKTKWQSVVDEDVAKASAYKEKVFLRLLPTITAFLDYERFSSVERATAMHLILCYFPVFPSELRDSLLTSYKQALLEAIQKHLTKLREAKPAMPKRVDHYENLLRTFTDFFRSGSSTDCISTASTPLSNHRLYLAGGKLISVEKTPSEMCVKLRGPTGNWSWRQTDVNQNAELDAVLTQLLLLSTDSLELSLLRQHHQKTEIREQADAITRSITVLDTILPSVNIKVGLIYVEDGQTNLSEMLENCCGSDIYTSLLPELGTLLNLQEAHRAGMYTAGLGPEDGTQFVNHSCGHILFVFHTTTLMQGDLNSKRRHIGNDFINVFYDSEHSLSTTYADLSDDLPLSPFNSTCLIVRPITASLFEIRLAAREDIQGMVTLNFPLLVSLTSLAPTLRSLLLILHICQDKDHEDKMHNWVRRSNQLDKIRIKYGELQASCTKQYTRGEKDGAA